MVNLRKAPAMMAPLVLALCLLANLSMHNDAAAAAPGGGPRTNILLLGVDAGSAMADTIIILSYDHTTYDSAFISVSRSTYVDFQTWSSHNDQYHLAFAHYYGLLNNNQDYDEAAIYTLETVEQLLGIPLHHYVTLREEGFAGFVDLIGGVEIYVSQELATATGLDYGFQRLDGSQAHTFVTYRGGTGGQPRVPEEGSDHADGDRVRRGQRMLKALLNQCKTLPPDELYDIYYHLLGESLFTDMDDWDLLEQANIFYDRDPEEIATVVLPGSYVLTPDAPGYFYLDREESDNILAGLGLKLAVVRLAGKDRYETAAKIALHAYPDGAATVILARGDLFADGLGGSALAGALEAPILLTGSGILPGATAGALEKLAAKEVILLGGPAAISGAVEEELAGAGLAVSRIYGGNRFDTAAAIAEKVAGILGDSFPGTAFIVSGTAMADSLVAGPVAAGQRFPILQVSADFVPPVTAAAIEALGIENLYIVGGPAVVSEAVAELLAQMVGGEVQRIWGADRFGTSVALARSFYSDPDPQQVILANGLTLVDALGGGYLGALLNAPVLYALPEQLPEPVADYFHEIAGEDTRLYILGGPAAICQSAGSLYWGMLSK